MPKFYPSIPEPFQSFALRQPLFFIASAPLTGKHINNSPKGLTDSHFAILSPNKAAYIDITGSGCETISHVRENGRVTVMFCSFDANPGIMRLFCRGRVVEWHEEGFGGLVERILAARGCVKGNGNGDSKEVVGARAVILLDVFKVQVSCGFGVPLLALSTSTDDDDDDQGEPKPKPYFKTRQTLTNSVRTKAEKNKLHAYQQEWNTKSLDGLPGLWSAQKDSGQIVWVGRMRNWVRRHRGVVEMVVLGLAVVLGVMQWWMGIVGL